MEICLPRLLSHAPLPLPLSRPPSHPFACSPPVPAFPAARNGARTTLSHFPKSVEQHKNEIFAAKSSTSEDISASISSQLDEQPSKVIITDETEAAEEVDESPKKYETPVPTVELTPPSEDISASISRQLDEQPGKVVITDESEAAEVDESPKKYEIPVPTVEVTPLSEDISASISMQLDEQPGKKVITDETEAAEEVDESPKKYETPVPTEEVTPPSEDISASISRQLDEQPGKVLITDETEAAKEVYESPKKYETPVPTVEVTPPSKEEPTESQFQSFQLLDDFNLELKQEDIYPILLYGGGSLLTLWISFAIIGAIDSIPLIPKMLEVVGLGYTVWFSYQYLIFKKNRDELVAKVKELKKEIIGGSEDV